MTPTKQEAAKLRAAACGWHFIVLMSRQGKIRLAEFFSSFSESEKKRLLRDITAEVLPRQPKMCNIIEKGDYKFVYRRYASLYFVVGIPSGLNELIVLEQIHLFVEALDGYFNSGAMCILSKCILQFLVAIVCVFSIYSTILLPFFSQHSLFQQKKMAFWLFAFTVCELDLVFSLHKSLMILFEMFIGGMLCESNKREVLKAITEAEELVEELTKPGEDTASQLDDGLSYQEQFQLGRKPGRRGPGGAAR